MRWVKVWDAPTRLFHWSVVLLLITSWTTQEEGWMALHLLSGYAMGALLLFRLLWGLFGSETARLRRLLRSPLEALRHLRHFADRAPDAEVGHNAAGGWMVLVLLGLLAAQVLTGLCANDDVLTQGPLADWVGKAWSDRLTGLHGRIFLVIEAAVLLHVLAVLSYAAVRRHDLVRPMLSGWKRLPEGTRAPVLRPSWLALLLLALAAGAAWAVASLG